MEEVTVRVVVVDDQPAFRAAMRRLFARTQGFDLVGEAATAQESVRLAARLHPDLVLMDINLPGESGISATPRVRAAAPDTAVVLVSTYPIYDLPTDVGTSGAVGYLHKEELTPRALQQCLGHMPPDS